MGVCLFVSRGNTALGLKALSIKEFGEDMMRGFEGCIASNGSRNFSILLIRLLQWEWCSTLPYTRNKCKTSPDACQVGPCEATRCLEQLVFPEKRVGNSDMYIICTSCVYLAKVRIRLLSFEFSRRQRHMVS